MRKLRETQVKPEAEANPRREGPDPRSGHHRPVYPFQEDSIQVKTRCVKWLTTGRKPKDPVPIIKKKRKTPLRSHTMPNDQMTHRDEVEDGLREGEEEDPSTMEREEDP